jgi:alkylation response protein AidB-like acyl-CoA dehydrogenase
MMVDDCVGCTSTEKLTVEQAAMAKWYATEAQVTVIDRCLQLHGGYGYMREYPSPGPTSTPASRRSTAEPPRS